MTILLFIPFLHAQEMKPVILPTAKDEVLAIIRYAEQGIRNNRADMVIAQLANRVEEAGLQTQLRKSGAKAILDSYFAESQFRMTDSTWSILSPSDSLTSNWDFTITTPRIEIQGDYARAEFRYSWLLPVPLTARAAQSNSPKPPRVHAVWHFRQTNHRWRIFKMENFLSVFAKATAVHTIEAKVKTSQ